MPINQLQKLRVAYNDESGAITPLMVMFVLMIFMLGGIGVDYSYSQKSRMELQGAADAVAHAAIYARQDKSAEDAREAAVALAGNVLPTEQFGNIVTPESILFGSWDADTQTFQVDANSKEAVLVTATRSLQGNNAVPAFFSSVSGRPNWDVVTGSVFETYFPTCLTEGFAAEDIVDVRSNNAFTNGFCLHSNSYVSVNSNNSFATGTIVSMPDKTQIDLPNSGYDTNLGLREALRDKKYNLRIVDRIEQIVDGIINGDPDYLPSYIYNLNTLTLSQSNVGGMAADAPTGGGGGGNQTAYLEPGRIYTKYCTGGKSLTLNAGVTLSEVVIITDCTIKIGQGVTLEDVVMITENVGSKSISAASGFQIGRNDGCAVGGGAQVITLGSFDAPADLRLYGGQLIARQDINFAANANGIEGASMIAGGSISGTSNMTMGFCGSGMETSFKLPYFRLAI